jgi:hypothetical protein
MSDNREAPHKRESLLENFAAELTHAAYRGAHQLGMTGSWLDLELGLGSVLAEKVKKWAWSKPPAEASEELKAWRDGFLVDLTEGALHIAVMNGVKGFPLEMEFRLYRAFRSVFIRRLSAGSEKERHS